MSPSSGAKPPNLRDINRKTMGGGQGEGVTLNVQKFNLHIHR